MPSTNLPFQPVRSDLYSSEELMQGFDPDDALSASKTLDFRIYEYFITEGKSFPTDSVAGMMESLADNSIAQAMFGYLHQQPKVAAIMGGHSIARDDQIYRDVVAIAKQLAEAGFIVATGGGPGVMEAAHLGALMRDSSPHQVTSALDQLGHVAQLPKTDGVVDADGNINEDIVRDMHAWMLPAWEIRQAVKNPGESLAVPTWYYGSEPLTPLATHVAKFFQNSIREDILLMLAAQGIVYANGRAGTIQEVFQDAAQNYYADAPERVCPMVFYARDGFWTDTLPVESILKPLFDMGRWRDKYSETVKVVHTPEEAAGFLINKKVPEARRQERGKSLGMTAMMRIAN